MYGGVGLCLNAAAETQWQRPPKPAIIGGNCEWEAIAPSHTHPVGCARPRQPLTRLEGYSLKMPEQATGEPFATKWQVKQLRGTVFLLPEADLVESADWWHNALGEEPEDETRRPREGILRQQGAFHHRLLTLQCQPDRVDWLLEVQPQSPPPAGTSATAEFFDILLKWLPVCPPAHRLAMGTILTRPVENAQDGYRDIAPFLPAVQIDPENSSDFLYQINRRRASTTIPGLRINGVTKWGVSRFETLTGSIAVNISGDQEPATGTLSLESLAELNTTLELDINTVPSSELIPTNTLPLLFREFIALGNDIAEKGDVL